MSTIDKLVMHGVSLEEIKERFCDDLDLYQECIDMFFAENDFEGLKDLIIKKQYDEAFRAAHTVKGIVGNLGLSVFFNEISILVESLRNKKLDNVINEYNACEKEYKELKNICL